MSDSRKSTNGSVTFLGLLFLVFLVLKLTHVIGWSWWLVTAPLWVPALIAVGLTMAALMGILLTFVVKASKRKK